VAAGATVLTRPPGGSIRPRISAGVRGRNSPGLRAARAEGAVTAGASRGGEQRLAGAHPPTREETRGAALLEAWAPGVEAAPGGIGPLSSRGLKPGEFRPLTPAEIRGLIDPPGAASRPSPPPPRAALTGRAGRRGRPSSASREPPSRARGPAPGAARCAADARRARPPHGRPPRGRPPRPDVRPRGLVVAIDGPSGAGKSTAGAPWPSASVTSSSIPAHVPGAGPGRPRAGVPLDDAQAVASLATRLSSTSGGRRGDPRRRGRDLRLRRRRLERPPPASPSIRRCAGTNRSARQREMGQAAAVVMDGRDIGTAVFRTRSEVLRDAIRASARPAARGAAQRGQAPTSTPSSARSGRAPRRFDARGSPSRAARRIHLDTTELGLDEVVRRMLSPSSPWPAPRIARPPETRGVRCPHRVTVVRWYHVTTGAGPARATRVVERVRRACAWRNGCLKVLKGPGRAPRSLAGDLLEASCSTPSRASPLRRRLAQRIAELKRSTARPAGRG